MDTGPLSGKVAIVHAGAPGWARSAVAALEGVGATVVLANGSPDAASGVDQSAVSMVVQGPFSYQGAVEAGVRSVLHKYGRLDVLINLPHTPSYAPASEVSDQTFTDGMALHTGTVYRWCRVVGAHMAGQKRGHLITFVSGLARRGLVNGSAFGMSQAALDSMVQSLALEWASVGVRVNGIGYGWVDTERRPLDEQQKERLVRFLPLRSKGHPDDYMGLMIYLASDASGFVTGQTVFIDGGAMAHA